MNRRTARFLRRLAPGLLALGLCAVHEGHAQTLDRHAEIAARPQIDVVFVLDGTGSMGDEIEPVKQQIWSIANRIASGNPRPDVRVGLVVYRDRSDAEHTRMVPLTRDLDAIHTQLMAVTAQGGGDFPEDVDAGLELALREMNWGPRAARMVFLVGDAPPQTYEDGLRERLMGFASQHAVEVNTIECSGMDASGHALWESMAHRTNGVAQVLTYAQDQQLADGHRHTVLRRGGETFVSARPLTDAERAEDARTLAARGVVHAASTIESESIARPARGAPAPSAASNNITDVVTRRVQRRAMDMGVAY